MPGDFDDSQFVISPARTKTELISLAALLRGYGQSLNVDLGAQGFQTELDALPGPYAPPQGELLLAKRGDHVLGCIALKPLEPGVAEIKRLFVREQARGLGVGKALIAAIITEARARGYSEIKLDTLPQMQSAIALYQAAGFTAIPPYGSHPYPGLVCFGKSLA
jgi:ribosomal protein S18 acetylase RimI-like enzyme